MSNNIITITLSPSIDKSTSVAALVPEKKLRCADPKFEPGGGGINVARAIKKLGGSARAIYLGGGHTGIFFKELLATEGIDFDTIETIQPMRENLVVFDNAANLQYRFGMPSPNIEENEWQAVLKKIEKAAKPKFIVASGSIPTSVPLDIFARMAAIAKQKKAKFIVDTSGEALKQAANEGVYLLKPNLGELSALVGKEELDVKEIKDVAQEVISKGHCEVMVVSMGAAGALLITNKVMKQVLAPPVKSKSTVGAGDSMVAGMVYSLSNNRNLIEAVQYGVACGTAATMNSGTELCKLTDVEYLFSLIKRQ